MATIVHVERIKDLFPSDVAEEMVEIPGDIGQCAYNSAKAAMDYQDYNVRYCEGWLGDIVGHAFNRMTDGDGNVHYFDISQEYLNELDPAYVLEDVELERELDIADVIRIFDEDGEAHLITVPIWKGGNTYAWYKGNDMVELYWD